MRWPWQHETAHPEVVGDVTAAARGVHQSAGRLRQVAAELDAAAELIKRNRGELRVSAGDRRRRLDPRYRGPERRHA